MLKRLVNEAYFTLAITTIGPVLVRSGHVTLTGPDMTPVLTYRDDDWQVYLPGSSLKGVIRSHLEKVGRTLQRRPDVICNPFHKLPDADAFCGDKFQHRKDNGEGINSEIPYRDSCPICRLFGSTEFIGRVSINDAYLVDGARARPTETRDGVGIDRLTGGASHGAKFDLEVVSSKVVFQTNIYLRNFETWQLGMLLIAVQDMADGLVRIGSGRSRGLGSVRGSVDEVTVNYLAPVNGKPPTEVWGMGKFQTPEERKAYRTWEDDLLQLAHTPQESRKGLRWQTIFSGDSLADLKERASAAFVTRLQNW